MRRLSRGVGGAAVLLACLGTAQAADKAAPFGTLPSFPLGLPAAPTAAPPTNASKVTLPSAMTADPQSAARLEKPAKPGGDLAFGAFQRGYYATALREALKRLAKNAKDGPALALVGEIYAQGLAVKPDPAEAAKWNRLASLQNNREGTFSYGMALLTGNGVPKDRKAARAQLQKAADMGHPGALYNLGIMALEGGDEGTARDFDGAARDFQKAADLGDVDALFALSTLVAAGRGVPADPARAAALMKQAADQKHIGAEVEYGITLFNGKGVPVNEASAARYFRMAAAQGNPVAENRLARLYAAGRGVPRDPVEAARWHILARAAGVSDTWLDEQLAALSPLDRTRVEELIRRQIGP